MFYIVYTWFESSWRSNIRDVRMLALGCTSGFYCDLICFNFCSFHKFLRRFITCIRVYLGYICPDMTPQGPPKVPLRKTLMQPRDSLGSVQSMTPWTMYHAWIAQHLEVWDAPPMKDSLLQYMIVKHFTVVPSMVRNHARRLNLKILPATRC